jgi:division protein CdvB (Snf7/Vps24/ESCRT-III family)
MGLTGWTRAGRFDMARICVAAVSMAVLMAGFAARAQTQGGAGSQDILPALLSEVRGLRTAMEQMATAGARVQLVLGRLQLQEQRLNTAIKRLDDIRTRLGDAQRSAAEMQEQLNMMETLGKEGPATAYVPRGDRPTPEQVEEMQRHLKRQIAHMNSEAQRFSMEEATAAGDVANEQARWLEFNQKLEELERGLARR